MTVANIRNIPRILAFSGPKGSGKDTAAAYLSTRNEIEGFNYFQKIAFAEPIKQMCMIAFGLTRDEVEILELKEKTLERWPFVTPRSLLQDVANHFRDVYGADVWVRAWLRQVEESTAGCVLVTDLRFPNEVERLKNMGAYIIYVQSDWAENKLKEAQEAGDPLALNVSESHWDEIKGAADVIMPNNGSIPDLFTAVEDVSNMLYGQRRDWHGVARTALHDLRTGKL